LNIALVPIYGYVAAGYTTLFSYLVYAFLIWRSSRKYIPWKIPLKGWLPAVLIAGLGVLLAGHGMRSAEQPLQVILRLVIFLFIYAIGILTILRQEEQRSSNPMGKAL